MHRTVCRVHIDAPPARVWDLVTRFDAFPSWTDVVTVSGELRIGEELHCGILPRLRHGQIRRWDLPGDVTVMEPGARLVWRLAGPGVSFEQSLTIVAQPRGVELTHAFDTHGLFHMTIGRRLEPKVRALSDVFLADAKRRLEGGVRPKPPAPPKAKTPRYLPPPRRNWR